jgi:hypothetical protein
MRDSNDGYDMGDMGRSTMISIHRTFEGAFRSLLTAARRRGWMDQIDTGDRFPKGHSCEEWLASLDESQKGQIMEQSSLSETYVTFNFDDTTARSDGSAEFMISGERHQE